MFMYGSFMNRTVLAGQQCVAREVEIDRPWALDIRLWTPREACTSRGHDVVYGILAVPRTTNSDVSVSIAGVSNGFPEAVVVEALCGRQVCHRSPSTASAGCRESRNVKPIREAR